MIPLPDSTIAAKFVIKTHYIMRVLEFHPEDQTVDLIQDVYEFTNSPYGTISIESEMGSYINVLPKQPDVLYNIPVKQLRWGQFEIQCCPAPGDTGYIEVFTNDIRDWMFNGSNSVPWSDAHFLKQSCVFVPFVPNKKNASENYPIKEDYSADLSKMVIKSANASIIFTDTSAETPEGSEPTVDITTSAQTLNINAEKGITVNGDINITGNISVKGKVEVEGTISSTEDITSETDVIGGGVSLKNHTHNFNYVGAGTGSSPQAGATETPTPQE